MDQPAPPERRVRTLSYRRRNRGRPGRSGHGRSTSRSDGEFRRDGRGRRRCLSHDETRATASRISRTERRRSRFKSMMAKIAHPLIGDRQHHLTSCGVRLLVDEDVDLFHVELAVAV